MDEDVEFEASDLLAYLQISDMTRSVHRPYKLSDRDKAVYERRRARAEDDGVIYEDEEEPNSPI
jgi:hypothetical protein